MDVKRILKIRNLEKIQIQFWHAQYSFSKYTMPSNGPIVYISFQTYLTQDTIGGTTQRQRATCPCDGGRLLR